MTTKFDIRFLVDRIVVAGQPLIVAGPQKSLKTSLLVDLAFSIATGGYFLGKFQVPVPATVVLMTGESGLPTIQETIRRIAHEAGSNPATVRNLIISDRIPQLASLDHLTAVDALIQEYSAEVLMIDPCMMAMDGADASNLFIQGQILRRISQVCQKHACTLTLCHHTKKNPIAAHEPLELSSIAWAGFAEFARQWILVNRREAYVPGTGDHSLWLSVGGSVGHSGLWGLDIHEGVYGDIGGRVWNVDIKSPDDLRQNAHERRDAQREEKLREKLDLDKMKACQAMAKFADGETANVLKDLSGLRTDRFRIVLAELLTAGDAVACQVFKAGRKASFEGYKLAEG